MNPRTVIAVLVLLAGLQACDKAPSASESAKAASPATAAATANPASATAPAPVAVSPAQIERIVAEAMRRQYPDGYEQKYGCWRVSRTSGDEQTDYCMRPGAAQVIDGAAGQRLYFFAYAVADINDDLRFAYDAADSGLMGAFELSLAPGGAWSVVSAENAMDFGTAGVCGCQNAAFVKLGADYYGWTFVSGGMWQGVIVSSHEIVAPHAGKFKNLSAIPEIREEAQDVRYRVEVVGDEAAREVYPLRVTKMRADKQDGERVVEFDREKWMYQEIGDL
jgi:hypothetical protein